MLCQNHTDTRIHCSLTCCRWIKYRIKYTFSERETTLFVFLCSNTVGTSCGKHFTFELF